MSEQFLHYVWKYKLFNTGDLITTDGESVEVVKTGVHNHDAGPDFFNAHVRIANTLWVGNVEIHKQSADWHRHKHHDDKAYDNIVLHVVYEDNAIVQRGSGEVIPTIELKGKIAKSVLDKYESFGSNNNWIPCEKSISDASTISITTTIDRMLLERLERKSLAIEDQLASNKNNWEETFYQQLANKFGFKKNAAPFELLAKSLPMSILAKHKNSLMQIEALLFGQSGLLNTHLSDKYLIGLQNEYEFLRRKYKLQPLESHLWKFLRLRPMNFPTLRIAQFSQLIYSSSHLFSKLLETESLVDVQKLFKVSTSEYWKTHYTLDKKSKESSKSLGINATNTLIINTVIPFLFVYGKRMGQEKLVDRAMNFLEDLPPETNSIIKQWKALELPVKSAYDTQALLQLKNEYCNYKKCLNCSIGNDLIKNS